MLTIAEMADQIGEHICKQAGLESEVKKVCFGIEVILVMVISTLTIFVFGLLLDIFPETVIIIVSALLMKFVIGGTHLSGFFRCLVYSTFLAITGAWLFKIQNLWVNTSIVLLLLLFNLIIVIFIPPAPSYRVLNRHQKIFRKTLAGFLIILPSLNYLYNKNLISVGALIGFSISVINISPMGTGFVRWLDRITKRGGVVQ